MLRKILMATAFMAVSTQAFAHNWYMIDPIFPQDFRGGWAYPTGGSPPGWCGYSGDYGVF